MVDVARRAGVLRHIVNGSSVTAVDEPNDVDCVLLVDDAFPKDEDAEADLLAGFPFLDVTWWTAKAFVFWSTRFSRPTAKGCPRVWLRSSYECDER
jgi:hypothetical protein